ncbi:hypothetical protein LCGC14_1511360, partial [marine sediment metagenome]
LNAHGKSSIIREVRLIVNGKIDVISLSGAQYHWLMRDNLEHYIDVAAHTDGRSAVAAGAFTLDMFLPVALNARDVPGLLLLQNEQTEVVLTVEFEALATIASGLDALVGSVVPHLELFSVPVGEKDMPPLSTVHSLIGETMAISAAGDQSYPWPRGNTYLQMIHGLGFGVSGSDGFSRIYCSAAGNQRFFDATPNALDIEHARFRGRARQSGVIPVDLLGSSGLGSYGSSRDVIYSQAITNLKSVITATGSGTLHSIRRELVTLE